MGTFGGACSGRLGVRLGGSTSLGLSLREERLVAGRSGETAVVGGGRRRGGGLSLWRLSTASSADRGRRRRPLLDLRRVDEEG